MTVTAARPVTHARRPSGQAAGPLPLSELLPAAGPELARDGSGQRAESRPLAERTIICAVDQSDVAPEVVREARRLARLSGAGLVLVHVVPEQPPVGLSSDPDAVREWRTIELERAHFLLDTLAKHVGRAPAAERRVAFGSPAQTLRALARRYGADYIVVGSHGKSALTSLVLGSVSAELCRSAPCPVIVVPPRKTAAGVKAAGKRHRDG